MSLLDSHLDQIVASAKTIADLDFPQPRIFTNALLGQHEITTLIRDTEPYERSLFTIDPSASSASTLSKISAAHSLDGATKRKTIDSLQQRQGSAVAKVLGNDMLRKIQQSSRGQGRSRGIDVEVLLQGSERLCAVYPVAGTKERASKVRHQHTQISESIAHYEALVLKQQTKLNRLNKSTEVEQEEPSILENETVFGLTEEDLRSEEQAIKDLEAKKKALELRVADMERDLGGLMR